MSQKYAPGIWLVCEDGTSNIIIAEVRQDGDIYVPGDECGIGRDFTPESGFTFIRKLDITEYDSAPKPTTQTVMEAVQAGSFSDPNIWKMTTVITPEPTTRAKSCGDFHDPKTWGGKVPYSGTLDAGGHIVTITRSINLHGGTLTNQEGGHFEVRRAWWHLWPFYVQANIKAVSEPCLVYSQNTHLRLIGMVEGGAAPQAFGVINDGKGTLTIVGTVGGGT